LTCRSKPHILPLNMVTATLVLLSLLISVVVALISDVRLLGLLGSEGVTVSTA